MSHLNSAQVALLQEIGSNLHQRRIELSLPMEEVAAKTHIRLALLKALELGQSDQLPEPIFVQGLIRRYGDVLGLDGATLAKTFPVEIHGMLPVFLKNSNTSSQQRLGIPGKVIYFYIIYSLLVMSAVCGLFYLLRRPQQTVDSTSRRPNLLLAQRGKTAAKPVSSQVVSLKTKPSLPIHLKVSLQDDSWLRVIVDGKTEFEGILTKGAQMTWVAKKQLIIKAGNAGVVLISLNQGTLRPLGKLDDVKEATFPSKDL